MSLNNDVMDNSVVSSVEVSLGHLIKLLPKEFDGDRTKLRSFIKQVDSVFELARPSQKSVLLLFVKNKIVGKARDQVDIHCNLTTWDEISDLLLRLYQDKKSLDQLMEELNSIRQMRNESISQFYQRLEELQSRILGTIHSADIEDNTLAGRVTMINEMTLNRFVYHSHPQISQMLRYRDFRNINNAFTAAVMEEKALRTRYDQVETRKCRICHKTNHNTNECYNNHNRTTQPINRHIHYNQIDRNSVGQGEPKQCRYCKRFGHVIEECRKREFNNSRPHSNSNQNSNFRVESQRQAESTNRPRNPNSQFRHTTRQTPTTSFSPQNATNRNTFSSNNNVGPRTTNFCNAQDLPNPPISVETVTSEFNNLRY